MFGKNKLAFAVFSLKYATISSLSTVFTGFHFILPASNAFNTLNLRRFYRTINSNCAMVTNTVDDATGTNNILTTNEEDQAAVAKLKSRIAKSNDSTGVKPQRSEEQWNIPS